MANIVLVSIPFRHLANFRTAANEFGVGVEPISPFDDEDEQDGKIKYYLNPFPRGGDRIGQSETEYYAFLSFLRNLESEEALVTDLEDTPVNRASYEAYFGEDGLRQLEII